MTDSESLLPILRESLARTKAAQAPRVRLVDDGAWPMQPSTDFVRDARGSAWIDSATERTQAGRPRRIKAARMSSYGHQVVSSYAVDLREERHLLLGACRFSRLELDLLASFDPDDPKAMEPVDAAIAEAKQSVGLWWTADRGSLVHAILEHDDRGADCPTELIDQAEQEFRVTRPILRRLRANWRAMLDRFGLRVIAIEQTVIADKFNAAGTLDRLVELQRDLFVGGRYLAAGSIVVLDLKTSALWLANGAPAYWGPYSCQVYLYAIGMPYWVGTDNRPDRRLAWPFDGGVDATHGLIGHVNLNPLDGPIGTCNLWHADLIAGRELALLSQQARQFEARRDVFVAAT